MSGTAVTLSAPDGSKAIIQLHGAQITSWSPAGLPEHLFMAAGAKVGEKAAMGGVPVAFPQFGDGPLLAHGFARDRPWRLISTRDYWSQLHYSQQPNRHSNWPKGDY